MGKVFPNQHFLPPDQLDRLDQERLPTGLRFDDIRMQNTFYDARDPTGSIPSGVLRGPSMERRSLKFQGLKPAWFNS